MSTFALVMTVRKQFLKLQEEIKTSQGLQGIFDCRIETKIMYPPGGILPNSHQQQQQPLFSSK